MHFRRRIYKAAYASIPARRVVLFGRKMRPLGVLLLLLTCQLATPIPIFDRDGVGFHSGHRSAGVGETIRDWFKVLKNRIVGKWQEWFGNDGPTPSLSPQDILNIDKVIENRLPGYPGLFLDLSNLSFDPKQDWGIRIGNWYVIRKITGNNFSPDSDLDEWDMDSLIPNLPSIPGIEWKSKTYGFGIPEVTRSSATTPRIEPTTSRRQTAQTVTQTESILTGSTVTATESAGSTVTTAEPIPLTTQLIATPTEPIVISTEETLISSESVVTNSESVVISVGSTLTSTEAITVSTESTVPFTESTMTSTEPILTSIETVVTSIEPTIITTESVTSIEETIITTTESPTTSTELILPILNKRIEDNETIDKQTTKKPRPASAEVIMF